MAEYLAPGVYLQDNPNSVINEDKGVSIGGFIGVTQRGVLNKPVLIKSWNDFINTFAEGMDSPFIPNSDLAYSVYGFFQNGGKKCYITRVAHSTVKTATATSISGASGLTINARDPGEWANALKIECKANAVNVSNFDIIVLLNGVQVEVLRDMSNTPGDLNYWVRVFESESHYLGGGTGKLAVFESTSLTGGKNGTDDLADEDIINALPLLDPISDINMLCTPGQITDNVNKAVMQYCENRGDIFGIIDASEATTATTILALRKKYSCKNAALYFPWIKVNDPLSRSNGLRSCPSCGHVMGVYSRIFSAHGFWKAPAGMEANIRGAVDVTVRLTDKDLENLNPAGIISLVPKSNQGIFIWGARNLNPDSSQKYVSDTFLDMNIKRAVYNSTQQYVFEPNTPRTWLRVATTVQTILDDLWRSGALKGTSPREAYYVKCDADLNTPETIREGKLYCEVGYAGNKPAEFIIFRFSHDVASN